MLLSKQLNRLDLKEYSIVFCSIVRDSERNLKKNIGFIEQVRQFFSYSCVIVFENDSKDNTKHILFEWAKVYENVIIKSEDYGQNKISSSSNSKVNPFYSKARISRMVEYRNKYLEMLTDIDKEFDFVCVLDLDLYDISIRGFLNSFALFPKYDVICANSYISLLGLKKFYYDTYALIELYKEEETITESAIMEKRVKWGYLSTNAPLIPVYSAFGGLAIYKYKAVIGARYNLLYNQDERVEVMCEHFSLVKCMRERGYNNVVINPELFVKYQKINLSMISRVIKRALKYQLLS